MSEKTQLALLKHGVASWNEWRGRNPGHSPALSGADPHLLGSGLSERGEERGERFGRGEMRVGAEELQLSRRVSRRQLGEHQPAEQLRKNPHRQAEVGLA